MADMFDQVSSAPESDGVWVTVSELARRKNITRQTALERVTRLEKDGLLETRRDGRSRLVEMATFDRLVGQTGNAYREQGAETKRSAEQQAPASAALRDAQSERAQYEAKLKALDLAERTGALVPVRGEHGIEAALLKVTEAIVRDLGAPMNWVSEILETVREGEPALRRLLRRKIHEQRETIANRLTAIAGDAAEAEKLGVHVDIDFGDNE
ncbi:winged helix-turn-helix domain-containing protein [Rhizobium sp. CNPSo 4039]|uniref:winged helix-turn-helix domain-containing protein n=1 Tax=Rhizobium sp. CNPSo 4039 TaxID=3021409 RepID=UPI00254D763B|nr:winged helix-turn-helix domain-containing protein [Rhizobium sp. CNPSo 4039]MDK4713003.1 winged helix-turn-helix domain-containing protein [Rhizobium sp. CNPSo 4039]